jgi:hypothetical protein
MTFWRSIFFFIEQKKKQRQKNKRQFKEKNCTPLPSRMPFTTTTAAANKDSAAGPKMYLNVNVNTDNL